MEKKNILWIGATLALAGAAGVLLDALILEKYNFEVKTFDIGENESNRCLKIILLADLHFKHNLLPQDRKLARRINEIQPDLILIAGDTIDSTGAIEPAERFFRMLDQSIRKVAIPGNNDYRASPNIEALKQLLKKYNCDMLINQSKSYNFGETSIMITGLDDLLEGDGKFVEAVQGIGKEKNHLLLIHSPLQQEHVRDQIKKLNQDKEPAEQLNISYIFAGHTHGGQVRLPGYVPVLPGKSGDYVNGWYNETAPYLYVSKGFGTSSIPLRFFSRAEVTVFNYYM